MAKSNVSTAEVRAIAERQRKARQVKAMAAMAQAKK